MRLFQSISTEIIELSRKCIRRDTQWINVKMCLFDNALEIQRTAH